MNITETWLILLSTPTATQNENKIVPCRGLRRVKVKQSRYKPGVTQTVPGS